MSGAAPERLTRRRVLVGALGLLGLAACRHRETPRPPAGRTAATPPAGAASDTGPRHAFDAARAFSYLETQVEFGPRIPGTRAHENCGDWLLAHLRVTADTVVVQDFTVAPRNGKRLQLRNFFARFKPDAPVRVLYVAHWDTHPRADQSAKRADRRKPVPGANDDASGVALLLGVADALLRAPPTRGVDLLFTDGQDYGDGDDTTTTLLGARYFAQHLPLDYAPHYAVVWDMVGDSDLRLPYEPGSQAFAPDVVDLVWRAADSLGYGKIFVREAGPALLDDQELLQRAGIRAIEVGDFDYGPDNSFHHSTEDTLDKVAAHSLQVVGDVALALLRGPGAAALK
ncbi:MAG TPA: M28 family peptidase [Gemmatimonadales bacterium]|nr:M28 family peptidase [Gemmatimonadales bacterium]